MAAGFPTGIILILAFFFIYKSPRCFLPDFKSIGVGSGEEAKNRFSRCPPRGFRIGTTLAIFDEQVTPMFLLSFNSVGFSFSRSEKIDFKDGRHGGHLGF